MIAAAGAVLTTSLTMASRDRVIEPSNVLEPIDQRVADTNPLSSSLRNVEAGLAEPAGFRDVYQHPDLPGMYLRADGALYAAFSQSRYDQTSRGTIVPVVPNNTVFSIGLDPLLEMQARRARQSDDTNRPPQAVDRLDLRADDYGRPVSSDRPEQVDAVVSRRWHAAAPVDVRYERVRSLLRRAAAEESAADQAARGKSGSSSSQR